MDETIVSVAAPAGICDGMYFGMYATPDWHAHVTEVHLFLKVEGPSQ